MKHVMRFLKDCEASIHIEYSIIALMIGVGVIYTVASIGAKTGSSYNAISAGLR
jgi:Flp pilus assembly pilin Flp